MATDFEMTVMTRVCNPTGSINAHEARRAVRDTLCEHLRDCSNRYKEPEQVCLKVTVRPMPLKVMHDSLKLPEKPKLRLFADPHRILFYVAADAPTAQKMHFERMQSTTPLVEIDLTTPGCH